VNEIGEVLGYVMVLGFFSCMAWCLVELALTMRHDRKGDES